MSTIPTQTLSDINNHLNEIGCELIGNNSGPITIQVVDFKPRIFAPYKRPIRIKTKRDEILEKYINECNENNIPAFASAGDCFSCGFDLVDVENECMKATSGCPRCNQSFCA